MGKEELMAHKENDFDFSRIEKILEIMKANDLVEIEIKQGEDKIFLKRAQQSASPMMPTIIHSPVPAITAEHIAAAQAAMAPAGESKTGFEFIKAPLVGTFYAAQSPDSPPFVEAGFKVEPQMVVCIIEAMKVMNEIKSEVGGTVVEVLVKNGQAVEFGQPLFKVKPE
jgi:acetyl-CoA carboxylase biotin carboxyl carrier protein